MSLFQRLCGSLTFFTPPHLIAVHTCFDARENVRLNCLKRCENDLCARVIENNSLKLNSMKPDKKVKI